MSGFSLKDHLFNRDKVEYLASLFAKQHREFATRQFVNAVMKQLPTLELKQRISWIAEILALHLPADYRQAISTIVASLPPPLDPTRSDDDFGDFILAPLGQYVVNHGLSAQHVAISLQALREITQRFSMEDAVRAFLRHYPQETLMEFRCWAQDSNYHVRRLVSESTRPLLPWSGRINLTPQETLPLLDSLHADPTRYVTRSVANHLHDISKSAPTLAIETLQSWRQQARQAPAELDWMTRHALRTLVKRGHPDALQLLGFRPDPKLTLGPLQLAQSHLKPGQTLKFSVEIVALRDECLVVDYCIDFVKAGGKRSTKVFKASTLDMKAGTRRTITKQHKLLAQATTYRLYPGEHRLTLQINGLAMATADFYVT